MATYLEPNRETVTFHTRSGPLPVTRDGDLYALDLPADPAAPVDEPILTEVLGIAPQEVRRATKTLAVLRNEAEVRAAQPDLTKLLDIPGDGLIITAPGDTCDFVSRYFAPHAGIPEDPVTGSAHVTLAPYWAERLAKSENGRTSNFAKRRRIGDRAARRPGHRCRTGCALLNRHDTSIGSAS